jgi:hypothetical protein
MVLPGSLRVAATCLVERGGDPAVLRPHGGALAVALRHDHVRVRRVPARGAGALPETAPEPAKPATGRHPGRLPATSLTPRRPALITIGNVGNTQMNQDAPSVAWFNTKH